MLLAAFLQMLTCLLIVGWIWSIRWGIIMVQLARKSKRCNIMTVLNYSILRFVNDTMFVLIAVSRHLVEIRHTVQRMAIVCQDLTAYLC